MPMSEARRQHIHGQLRPLAKEARAIGEPTILQGVALLAAILVSMFGVVMVVAAVWGS